MKQKIVIKVPMPCEKCRVKVMKIVAQASGVISVAIKGSDKDQVEVIGDSVDSACLTKTLRKKVAYATIVSVQEVTEKPKDPIPPTPLSSTSRECYYSQCPVYYAVPVCDTYPTHDNCSIM